MNMASDFEQIVRDLAKQIKPMISTPTQCYDDKLAQWIRFHGLEGADVPSVVAYQASLNLLLKALICRLTGLVNMPRLVPAHIILAEFNKVTRNAGWGALPLSYLDELAITANLSLDMRIIEDIELFLRQNSSDDVIGTVYTKLIPQEARRILGQFWTPAPIAEFMTRWAVRRVGDDVLDPAFGSGIFLLMAIKRLITLGQTEGEASKHVAGVELSPLAFVMGAANILLRFSQAKPALLLGDFIIPQREPLTILRESTTDYNVGALQLTLPGLEPVAVTASFPGRFDAIICNPPYTRHHRLPETYKKTWAIQVEQQFGLRLSRFSSLFAYFVVQATRLLKSDGRMAFITPAAVFEAFYSRQVKEFIRRHLRLRAIITFHESLSVFEGVDTAACITLLEGLQAGESESVIHIEVRRWPGVETLLNAVHEGKAATYSWGITYPIVVQELKPHSKWTIITRENQRLRDERFIPLSKIARIMRGIATGANDFFVLSDAEVERWRLNSRYLRPVLTKNREAPGYIFDKADFNRLGLEGKKRWLLYLTEPVQAGTPEAEYIHYGEELGLHLRSLVQTRPLWYLMEQREPAPIYFTYLSRKRTRFIHNRAGVLALNVFLCIYPEPAITEDEERLKALLAVLNSIISKNILRHIGRTYGGDTIKLEPREMDHLPVLNPLKLEDAEYKYLSSLFDKLCCADSEESEEAIRRDIDKIAELSKLLYRQ